MTINKTEFDNSTIFSRFFVFQYNHINAKKVVKGIEASNAANKDERLAISETATTTIAVIIVLRNK